MSVKSKGQSLLENALKLATPDDNQLYYNAFAATYDSDFATTLGYQYPKAVASIYRNHATKDDRPIADIGCGTGLVATALACSPQDIDGIDISEEMLSKAKAKGLYRSTIKADLTASLNAIQNNYGAVISAGTFTSGHLGPEPLEPLLHIAKAGALFVIGVNRVFYDKAGFDAVITGMRTRGLISNISVAEVQIYDRAGHEHSTDKAYVLSYRKMDTAT